MKYELNENQLKNLLAFLDRVEYKGLKEIQLANELLYVFNSPIQKENQDKEEDK